MDKVIIENKSSYKPVPGIPSIRDVEAIQDLEFLSMMREYSDNYLLNNKISLEEYRWIKDAFNQWSRLYEYPYCYDTIKNNLQTGAHILDAGSGVTFFPFFLNSKYKITCIDQDDYEHIYNEINKRQKTTVNFIKTNLQNIPYPNDSFDAIYSISVLEHTENYDAILKEFYRLLKPNGLLIITFDISLDNNEWGLNRDAAILLIENIGKYFDFEYKSVDLCDDLKNNDLYTTEYVQKYKSQNLLPWSKPTTKSIIKNLLLRRKIVLPTNLTFCNIAARKV